ncbi:MAG: hypothetical protein HYX92_05095 [Chloroflexi bacterium]|nr:hypothetical protein [Chloroflexota bacterium]
MTPVGARCRDCARMRRLPTFDVTPRHYVIAAMTGLGAAVASSIVWYVLASLIPFLWLFMALPASYGIAEAISLSVNRKRTRGLQAMAAGCFLLSYLLVNVLSHSMGYMVAGTLPDPGTILLLAIRAVVNSLLSIYSLIFLALGVIIAASRFR